MKIVTKTQNKVRDFGRYLTVCGEWYSDYLEIGPFCISLRTELADDGESKYLEASIRWCYSVSTAITARFSNTEEGFVTACNWLDEQRIRFIKTLL